MLQMPVIDWSLNIGAIIHLSGILLAGIAAYFAIKNDIKIITLQLEGVQEKQATLNESFIQLSSVLTQVAVQDTRLNMLEKRIDELSHGRGFVKKTQ